MQKSTIYNAKFTDGRMEVHNYQLLRGTLSSEVETSDKGVIVLLDIAVCLTHF